MLTLLFLLIHGMLHPAPLLPSDCANRLLDVQDARPCLAPIRAASLPGQPLVQPLSYEPITNTTDIDKNCGDSSDYSIHINLCFFHERLPLTLHVTRDWEKRFCKVATMVWNSDSPKPNFAVINLGGTVDPKTPDEKCRCADHFSGILDNGIMYGELDYRNKSYTIRKAGSAAFTDEEQKQKFGAQFHSFIV